MSRAARSSPSAYDLIAIGSGPAGQHAAIEAAKLGRRVAIVERAPHLGGVATNTGTLPSTTLRAAIVDATGAARGIYRPAYGGRRRITLDDLLWRMDQVIESERQAIRDRLRRSRVDLLRGRASFVDARTLSLVSGPDRTTVSAERFVIAVGTVPGAPAGSDLGSPSVLDPADLLRLRAIPRTLTVVGAGIVGLEYASMFAALGTRVAVVDRKRRVLDQVDEEMADALLYHLRGLGIELCLGEAVSAIRRMPGGRLATELESGRHVAADVVLNTAGRMGATAGMNLDAVGIAADARGRIAVDERYRTAQPSVFAAGDVIGSPGLAASPHEQGRLAALAALGRQDRSAPALTPHGIGTIPEISFVGRNEHDVAVTGMPYARGVARYRDLDRGRIAGDRIGLLKLLVDAESRRVLGVHIFGTAAAELVHIGQTVMAAGLPVDYLVDAVFGAPTYAGAFKLAALDAVRRLARASRAPAAAA